MLRVEIDADQRFSEVGLDAVANSDPPDGAELAGHVADATAWVAVADKDVAGFALAATVDGQGHLHQVSVMKHFGGQGIGRSLICQVHEWARAHRFACITLTTFADVAWNGPYYSRLGYVPLSAADCGPELRAIRNAEESAGLDVAPRIAMHLELAPTNTNPSGPKRATTEL